MSCLELEIREQIARHGPLTFDRFMELALYHPSLGYYRRPRDPFGARGDYFTNAQLQPVFGRLIAQKIAQWKAQLGSPAGFTVVELGAGRGETAREVRAVLPHIHYIELERGAGLLPEAMVGVVFSNEFFDALPVHVVRFDRGRWTERYVGLEQGSLTWTEGGLSCPPLESYLRRFAREPAQGQILEVSFEGLEWLERIARALQRGYVLTIDYGYQSRQISQGRRFPEGSLMSYHRHAAHPDVLAAPGERDITAHVNFTALAEHGESLGLRASPLETQAQLLLSIGRADEFGLALAASGEEQARRHRLLLKTLLFGMGETFQALVQEKP